MKCSGVICVLLTIMLSGCGVTIKTRGTNVPLEITAELTVDGRPMTRTWAVPGVPARESPYHAGSWSTYPALGTVLVRLPNGEGLWIDTTFGPQVNDVAGSSEKSRASLFYFVDSVSNPQILTDYFNSVTPDRCPADFRIRNCDIAITIKRLPDGPARIGPDVGGGDGIGFGYPDRMRSSQLAANPPAFYLSLTGTLHTAPGMKSDDLLGPLVRDAGRPIAIQVDFKGMERLAKLAGESVGPRDGKTIHLRYLGGKRWSVTDHSPGQMNAQPISSIGYRVPLSAADVQCCSAPTEAVKPQVLPTLGGEVEWHGDILTYDLTPLEGRKTQYWDVLYDPRTDSIIVLTNPAVKPVWVLPPSAN